LSSQRIIPSNLENRLKRRKNLFMYAAKNQPFSIYYTRVFHPVKTVVVTV